MKKIVSVLMLVFALFLGGCGNGGLDVTNDDYKFDSLQAQISSLNQQIADLKETIANLPAGEDGADGAPGEDGAPGISPEEIAAINVQIAVLQGQATDLTNELNALKGVVDGLDSRITELEAECSDVNATLTALITRVQALEDAIEALQNESDPPRLGSLIFTGTGCPGEIEGSQPGDFYIDLDERDNGNHKMYLLTSEGWVYFGQIFKATGPEPRSVVVVK